jgi:hypothetical protein
MVEATYLPYHYVDYLRHPGIPFSGGVVALNVSLRRGPSVRGRIDRRASECRADTMMVSTKRIADTIANVDFERWCGVER